MNARGGRKPAQWMYFLDVHLVSTSLTKEVLSSVNETSASLNGQSSNTFNHP